MVLSRACRVSFFRSSKETWKTYRLVVHEKVIQYHFVGRLPQLWLFDRDIRDDGLSDELSFVDLKNT